MFGRKKLNQTELQAEILQTQVELRRLHDRFEYMLERELREAKKQRTGGVSRPSNYDRIKVIYHLLQVTDNAYHEARSISDTDQLSRVTNDLSAALGKLNALSGQTQQVDAGKMGREVRKLERGEALRTDEVRTAGAALEKTAAAEAQVPFEQALEQMLERETVRAQTVPGGDTLSSDEELDELNRKLNAMIDAL